MKILDIGFFFLYRMGAAMVEDKSMYRDFPPFVVRTRRIGSIYYCK